LEVEQSGLRYAWRLASRPYNAKVHSIPIWLERSRHSFLRSFPWDWVKLELTILNQVSHLPRKMDFKEEPELLGNENAVQRHELVAAIQARILPGMSARRTGRLVWSPPPPQAQRFDLRLSPAPPRNTPPLPIPSRPATTAPSTSSSSSSTPFSSFSGPSSSSSVHLPPELSPPWPWSPSETQLIRAGYSPAYKPPAPAEPTPEPKPSSSKKRARKPAMAEPRARAARHKGQMNFASERTHSFLPDFPCRTI
jgi:transcription initiation factor TFIID subunit 13